MSSVAEKSRGGRSKRRRMYFRETSKRDSAVPPEVEERNYRKAFCQYCAECMEKYGLQSGKIGIHRLGVCSICGDDGFISGCLGNDNPLTTEAHCKWTREHSPALPESIFLVHTGEGGDDILVPIPRLEEVK